MKIKANKKLGERLAPPRGWHIWFAWYPVFVESGEYCWLENVERRLDAYYGNEYRALK